MSWAFTPSTYVRARTSKAIDVAMVFYDGIATSLVCAHTSRSVLAYKCGYILSDVSSIINSHLHNIKINITENCHFTLAYLLGKLG